VTDAYADLQAEGQAAGKIVADLVTAQWDLAILAPGWPIKHQVTHLPSLAWIARIAASDPGYLSG
jgi:Mycothiol maleylpyruvate isomerase N-terminal domain